MTSKLFKRFADLSVSELNMHLMEFYPKLPKHIIENKHVQMYLNLMMPNLLYSLLFVEHKPSRNCSLVVVNHQTGTVKYMPLDDVNASLKEQIIGVVAELLKNRGYTPTSDAKPVIFVSGALARYTYIQYLGDTFDVQFVHFKWNQVYMPPILVALHKMINSKTSPGYMPHIVYNFNKMVEKRCYYLRRLESDASNMELQEGKTLLLIEQTMEQALVEREMAMAMAQQHFDYDQAYANYMAQYKSMSHFSDRNKLVKPVKPEYYVGFQQAHDTHLTKLTLPTLADYYEIYQRLSVSARRRASMKSLIAKRNAEQGAYDFREEMRAEDKAEAKATVKSLVPVQPKTTPKTS